MQDLMLVMGWGEWDGGHRQVVEGVVVYARPDDDDDGCVGLLGQNMGFIWDEGGCLGS